ncbi:MAG: hypothetical protein ACRDRX_21515 [Pseudonocardiaceae bacterium]
MTPLFLNHVLQVGSGESALAHVLLFKLSGVLACFKSFGDENSTGLTAHTFDWMKTAKAVDVSCT